MRAARERYWAGIVLLGALYVVAGRLGLKLDAVSGFATLVWAPTGISLAALTRFGMKLWPGVALGAFVVNLWAGAPILAVAGITIGNTLEALSATYLLQRFAGFQPSFRRLRDVLGLIVIGAGISPLVSATIGTTSLLAVNVVTPERYAVTWSAWWIGDAVGALVVAPLLLSWLSNETIEPDRRRFLEAFALAGCVVVTSLLVFATAAQTTPFTPLRPYFLSPLLIWAALRFRVRGAATAIFLVSAIAVWGTVIGHGPFTGDALYYRLGALQAYMAILALTFLVLGAVSQERVVVNQELQAATIKAEAASQAKTRFLAVVSHELRTPLSGIIGYSNLMLENIGGELSSIHRTYVSRVRSVSRHLASVIEEILTFSRGDIARNSLQLETVDAVALLTETAEFLAPQAAVKQLELRITGAPTAQSIHTDPGKVRQILVNLVGNAIKFTDSGVIDIELQNEADHLRFLVRDSGPGIPPADFDRIFEPFTQLSSSKTRLPEGTGLGLAISRMLADALGGTVEVASEEGVGSTFTLRLPIRVTI
jgi:signal transduction histidine kinase